MFNRITLLVAAGALATACASSPAAGPVATSPATPAASTAPVTATVANLAATTAWVAEENLIPDDPVLALVAATNGSTDSPQGIIITCNAANGGTVVKLGKQLRTRVGETATYRVRTGAGLQEVEGRFQANAKSGDADFVFPIRQADLLALSQLDMVSVLSDTGEVQWALVKDVSAKPQAKYIGSLKDMPKQATDFVAYCNPK